MEWYEKGSSKFLRPSHRKKNCRGPHTYQSLVRCADTSPTPTAPAVLYGYGFVWLPDRRRPVPNLSGEYPFYHPLLRSNTQAAKQNYATTEIECREVVQALQNVLLLHRNGTNYGLHRFKFSTLAIQFSGIFWTINALAPAFIRVHFRYTVQKKNKNCQPDALLRARTVTEAVNDTSELDLSTYNAHDANSFNLFHSNFE